MAATDLNSIGYPPAAAGQQQAYPMPMPGEPQKMPMAQLPGYDASAEKGASFGPPAVLPPFSQINGYENTTGLDAVMVGPPPPYSNSDQPTTVPEETFNSSGVLTEDEAKSAIVEFVGQHCCYGKSAAANMNVKTMQSAQAYDYSLETFHEKRETNWQHDPYDGHQPVDGPMHGHPPAAWDIYVAPPAVFCDQISHAEVPHTASVQGCDLCHQRGKIQCHHCHGRGRTNCTFCHGSGNRHVGGEQRSCTLCHGSGHRSCSTCHGNGVVMCTKCLGSGQVKVYIRLTISWKTRKDNHVSERTDLPNELIQHVQGDTMFSQELPKVYPLTSFPEDEVNQESQRLVASHTEDLRLSRILMQRHDLRAVPVTEIAAEWKSTTYRFWVYGKERRVHCSDYPQQCCCGCTIL